MLDEVDRKILSILSKNARTPLLEIAKQVGMSNTAVKKRLKKLEESGVILGYCAKISKQAFKEPTYLHILHVPNDALPEFMRALLSVGGVEHAFHNAVGKTHVVYLFLSQRSLPAELLKFCKAAMVSRVEEIV